MPENYSEKFKSSKGFALKKMTAWKIKWKFQKLESSKIKALEVEDLENLSLP